MFNIILGYKITCTVDITVDITLVFTGRYHNKPNFLHFLETILRNNLFV